mgnify:CR=1 FL=1
MENNYKIISYLRDTPIYANDEFSFVKVSEVPEVVRSKFISWLSGQTLPYFEDFMAAFSWDFDRFMRDLPIID